MFIFDKIMTVITVNEDCGNSPRKAFLKDFNIAFAGGDLDFLMEHVAEDVVWEMHGDRVIRGKADMRAFLEEAKDHSMKQLSLDKIITHGRDAAASGCFTMNGKEYAFCDIYGFAGAKGTTLNTISSFVIEL